MAYGKRSWIRARDQEPPQGAHVEIGVLDIFQDIPSPRATHWLHGQMNLDKEDLYWRYYQT